jgi:prepilin-type N-terminal cleavage/methylation domain-containing protein
MERPLSRQALIPSGRAVTLLELLAVVLILGILATIATNVYVGQVERARIAATSETIRELSVAITRYEIDTGEFPPSGTGTIANVDSGSGFEIQIIAQTGTGNGLLYESLVHSLSGDANNPIAPTWAGPYISFNAEVVQFTSTRGRSQIVDAWGRPFQHLRHPDYGRSTETFVGAELFPGVRPTGASIVLPSFSPHAATETFYNPSTFQIFSFGPNRTTLGAPFRGTEFDDINNY